MAIDPQLALTAPMPSIAAYDLATGRVSGTACAGCRVEVFSTTGTNAAAYEGSTTAGPDGAFTFEAGHRLAGPDLRATATAADGTTSTFSVPASAGQSFLQVGDRHPPVRLVARPSNDLAPNRLSTHDWFYGARISLCTQMASDWRVLGFKRVRLSFDEPEVPYDPATSELSISPEEDACIDALNASGIAVTYAMSFWDKQYQAGGGKLPCSRFQTEGEIARYLDYVRFIVGHFKGRVEAFQIWGEPDNTACQQGIKVADYIALVKRTAPVIRATDPGAKIAAPGTQGLYVPRFLAYLHTFLRSDAVRLVDIVAWHPFYGQSPAYPDVAGYYRSYPALVATLKKTAEAAGFRGEYRADEITFRTHQTALADQPWEYDEVTTAKYYARSIVMHLGLDVGAGVGLDTRLAIDSSVIANLATVLAGAESAQLPIRVTTSQRPVATAAFTLSDGSRLVAVWNDGITGASKDVGTATVELPGQTVSKVVAVDVLNGVEQEVDFSQQPTGIVIRDLNLRDYPILLRVKG